jgi:hypothetical protein
MLINSKKGKSHFYFCIKCLSWLILKSAIVSACTKLKIQFNVCCSPAAAGAQTLALGTRTANNDMNSGLCQAAMAQFIFWRVYLSSADKQKGVGGSPQVSLNLCTRIGCHVAMAMSPSAEHHVLQTGFSQSHAEREQGSSATIFLDCCNPS